MTKAKAGAGRSGAEQLLEKYWMTLKGNDIAIAGLETLQRLPDPTNSQRVRMKDLEEKQIPEGIRTEQELGAQLRDLMDEAFRNCPGGPESSAKRRAIIELRYMNLLNWTEVSETIYGEAADYDRKKQAYLRQTFRIHREAVKLLDAALQRRSSEGGARS